MISRRLHPRTRLAARASLRYSFPWRPPCPVPSSAPCATKRKSTAAAKNTAPSARGSITSVCGQAVCTIAPNAAKPAMSLQQTPVAAEPKSIELHIDADARLAAAAGGAARYFGGAAGLENSAIAKLQAATVSACVRAFEHLTPENPRLDVTLTRLADRIEVALSHEGEGKPPFGRDSAAGFPARIDQRTTSHLKREGIVLDQCGHLVIAERHAEDHPVS